MVLAVAPCFDDATKYSFKWVRSLLSELGREYTGLFGDEATRMNFEREVEKHNLVIFYDHGDRVGLIAQGGGYLIDKSNSYLLRGKIIYTLACLWCSDGGIDAWRKGAKVVWGYTDDFGFTSVDEELFGECANFGLIAVFKENVSWEEALELARKKFNEAMGRARDPWSVIWLRHNRDALVCYTERNPPKTSRCFFRRMLIKIIGPERAWRITMWEVAGALLFSVGYGISIHDFAHQVWELKGTVLSLEGGYIGFGLTIVGFLILLFNKMVSHSRRLQNR